MEKKCPECGEKIVGRIDKKFCSDMCRNAHNNRENSTSSNHVRNVNRILLKNRRILEELVPEETAKASKTKLVEKGFSFKYHTSTYTNKKGAIYFFCYDYGYLPIEHEYYFLVKNREMNN